MAEKIDVGGIMTKACKLPYCKIDRDDFLRKELTGWVSQKKMFNALENGTINAGVPKKVLDEIADGAIKLETTKATAISTAAGIPGGLFMFGTIPADLAQYYAHVFRIAQKLAYVYGFKEIDLNDATQNVLMVFLGVMFGVNVANAALIKLAAANAVKIGTRVASKPLSKYALYNIAKKVLAWVGVKLTKDGVKNAISKAIPFVGGAVSGGLTLATYLPMAKKLKKELAKYASMTPEELSKESAAADEVLADYMVDSGSVAAVD